METFTAKFRKLFCASLLSVCATAMAQTNCVTQPSGLVDWWQAENNALDSAGGHNGTTSSGVSYITGKVGKGFGFLNGAINFGSSTANFGTGDFTIEYWLKTSSAVSDNYQIAVMEKQPACNAVNAYWSIRMGGSGTAGHIHMNMASNSGQDPQNIVATKNINDGNWHHVAFTRSNVVVAVYLDGALDNRVTNASTATLSNSAPFTVGQSICSCCDGTQVFSGGIDELSIYNRALSDTEIGTVYNAGVYGKCGAPPVIVTQPASQTVVTNGTAGFTVVATGQSPLTYQWSFNSSPLSGATNASLVINNVQLINAGTYSVFITNVFGSAQSSNAVLTVTTNTGTTGGDTNCAPVSNGLVDWWQAESNALDSVGTNNGTVSGGVTYSVGEVGRSFVFDGTGAVAFGPNAGRFGTGDFSVEFWMNTTAPVAEDYQMALIEKRPDCSYYQSLWGLRIGGPGTAGHIRFEVSSDNVDNGEMVIGSKTVNNGQWHHIVATRTGGTMSLYVDGALDTRTTVAGVANIDNTTDLMAGAAVCDGIDGTVPYTGKLDEISLYNRVLSDAEILAIYSAGAYGKCGSNGGTGTAPVITQQPVSLTAQTNSMVGFTVTATGTPPLSYQWSFNATPISGATNSGFTIASVQLTNAGTYSVLVSNPFGSAPSSNATLTVTVQSTNCTGIPGLVNWWRGEANALDSIGTNNGTITSGTTYATGEVGQGFQLSSSGVTMDAEAGNFRTNDFTVEFWMKTASSTPAILVGKRLNCGLGSAWNIMIGYINGASYPGKIGFELLSTVGDYSAVAPNTVTDNQWHHIALTRAGTNGSMYVDGALRATNTFWPSSTIDFNNTAPLKIGLSPCQGPGGLAPYTGNLDELAIYNRVLSAAEIQNIYVAGSLGKCGSSAAPVITIQPTNIVATVGSTVNVGVGAVGSQPLGYNWIFNSTNIYFTTNSPLVINNVQLTNAGTYYVVVTNVYGSATSSNATLTVGVPPTVTANPQSQTSLQFQPVTFSANASGSGLLAFQWQRNGASIAQATNSTYTIASVHTTDAASYRVVVTNQFGSLTSSNAVLTVFTPNVRLENAAITIGPVTVPLRMVAGGNENSVSVSVNFPYTNLIYSSTVLGSNAAGAVLTVNTNQLSTGKLGLGVFFVDSSNFGVGTQELARVTFYPGVVTNAVTNALTFVDVPTVRQVLDTNFNALVTTYSNAVVTMPATDLEGDVAPRTNGNRSVNIGDWTQTGRFVAGLDVVSNTLEFLRADSAPRTNGGDGRLSIADWVQAGRYALGFDPVVAIGGPTNFSVAQTPKLPTRPVSMVVLSQNGVTNVVAVHLNAQGDENAVGFSLSYDPAQLSFASASLGSGASGAVLNVNSAQAASGHVGIALAAGPGNALAAGDLELARVTFVSSSYGSYSATLGFGDQPILREIADANATTESASYTGLTFGATGQLLPMLTATLQDTNIVLSWNGPATGFNLESTTPLGTNWNAVSYTPATNGSIIVVTQAISADQIFFRLRHP